MMRAWIGKLTFVQVGVPSRTPIRDYRELNHSIQERVNALNFKWAAGSWKPIVFIHNHLDEYRCAAEIVLALSAIEVRQPKDPLSSIFEPSPGWGARKSVVEQAEVA